jgi:hypothetical protein
MKTLATIFLLLPVLIFFCLGPHWELFGMMGFLGLGVSASLICLIWGFYIFPHHRRLAWCCLIFAILYILIFLGAYVPIMTQQISLH